MNASFLRISATVKALRIVASIARPPSARTISWQVPPAASMRSRAAALKPWAWTVSALVSSPLASTLTGMPLRVARPLRLQRLERDLGAGLEARLEVEQVDRLRVRAERLERHRLLHVRAAQLAHPHVDRHLAALEAGAVLGAGARAVALLAAAGGLAGARALAAADALARPARPGAGVRLCRPIALLGVSCLGSALIGLLRTSTRWRTVWSMPRTAACPLTSTVWPMRRRPSERSVSSWRLSEPLRDLRCVIFSVLTTASSGSARPTAAGSARPRPSPPPAGRSSSARRPRRRLVGSASSGRAPR